MTTVPFHFLEGHLFLELNGGLWLLDTGAPTSFGTGETVTLAGEAFHLADTYLGLTVEQLSGFVHADCQGLLGGDVLARFDLLLDAPGGEARISNAELEHAGIRVPLEQFMGIPIVRARISGSEVRMFFDTGAKISYLCNDELRAAFPEAGRVGDFYPGFGEFETETRNVDLRLGELDLTLRCGVLPGILGATLAMAGTEGIIGNRVVGERRVGYFPRRRLLVL